MIAPQTLRSQSLCLISQQTGLVRTASVPTHVSPENHAFYSSPIETKSAFSLVTRIASEDRRLFSGRRFLTSLSPLCGHPGHFLSYSQPLKMHI